MSGLCGVVWWGGPVEGRVVEGMVEGAPWRAVDGSGVWVREGAGLGFGRLALTAEDDLEVQPFDDGRVCVVADCRLDDRPPLIEALEDMGPWRWEVPTDVELVARAYHRWGRDCASHLLGDFAFAVWDYRHRRLLCARDPMGMRPLYYHSSGDRIMFASEIKQILTHPDVPRRIHEPFIAAYLSDIHGPIEWTAYQGITQLAPATTLVHDGDQPRIHTHWQPDPHHRIRLDNETEYALLLRDTLTQAVKDRLRTNRQPGLLLSGGMDSGSIASIAGLLHQQDPTTPLLHTYSWAFEELTQCDERHISRHITDHYQLPTHDVKADQLWPLAHYPKHGPDPDEPYIGAFQALIEHTLQHAAHTNTRLLLGGDRGDEMIGGPVFDTPGLLRNLPVSMSLQEAAAGWRAVGGLRGVVKSRFPARRREAVAPWNRFSRRSPIERAATSRNGRSARLRRSRLILDGYPLRVAVLHDRTRSRHHLAFADPWSDRRLAELVLAVPPWVIQRRTERKRLLRLAMSSVIPRRALSQTGKTELTSLYTRGLAYEEVEIVRRLFEHSLAASAGFLDARRFIDGYMSWVAGSSTRFDVWWPITLEWWMRDAL